MTYIINNSQLSITNAPDLRGVSVGGTTIYSGGSNTSPNGEITKLSNGVEINLGPVGKNTTLIIPEGLDIEKIMDAVLVKTGDMTQDDFDTKWPDTENQN